MMDRRGSCWLALRMGRSRGRKGAAFVVVGSGGADCIIPQITSVTRNMQMLGFDGRVLSGLSIHASDGPVLTHPSM
jgi:multimeric flavodoxin WrbA